MVSLTSRLTSAPHSRIDQIARLEVERLARLADQRNPLLEVDVLLARLLQEGLDHGAVAVGVVAEVVLGLPAESVEAAQRGIKQSRVPGAVPHGPSIPEDEVVEDAALVRVASDGTPPVVSARF